MMQETRHSSAERRKSNSFSVKEQATQQTRLNAKFRQGHFIAVGLWKVACVCGLVLDRVDDPCDDRSLVRHVAICPAVAPNSATQAAAVSAQATVANPLSQSQFEGSSETDTCSADSCTGCCLG